MVLCQNLAEVAVNGGGEVAVAWGGDGEVWGERDCLWVGPVECGGLGPHVHWVSNGRDLRDCVERDRENNCGYDERRK